MKTRVSFCYSFRSELWQQLRCSPPMPEKHFLVSMSQPWRLPSTSPSSIPTDLWRCPMARSAASSGHRKGFKQRSPAHKIVRCIVLNSFFNSRKASVLSFLVFFRQTAATSLCKEKMLSGPPLKPLRLCQPTCWPLSSVILTSLKVKRMLEYW